MHRVRLLDRHHGRQQPAEDAQDNEQPDAVPERNALVNRWHEAEVALPDAKDCPAQPERNGQRHVAKEAEKPSDERQFVDH